MVRSASSNSQRIENLRETVGDFGIALFAPLLDLVDHQQQQQGDEDHQQQQGEESCYSTNSNSCSRKGNISSSCTTLQTEPESDHYRSETDDDYEDEDETSQPVQVVAESETHLHACPRILSQTQMQGLKDHHLPEAVRDNIWERCFAIGLHGDSFCSLLQKCAGYKYTVVVIRTVSGEILGGFASEEWRVRDEKGQSRNSYYGTGQSFVFCSHPDVDAIITCNTTNRYESDDDDLYVYKWTGVNDYCQICDNERRVLCMGGVGEFGWIVSDDFTTGQTGACATFGNPPLLAQHSATFAIANFEIYGLAAPVYGFGRSYESSFFIEQQQQPAAPPLMRSPVGLPLYHDDE